MLRYSLIGLMLMALFAVSMQGTRAEEEQEIQLKDCPKAVQKTLKRESRGGKLVEVEVEKEDGKTTYEAEVILDGKEYEVEVAEDGTLISKILEDDEDEEAEGDDEDGEHEDDDDDEEEDDDDDNEDEDEDEDEDDDEDD